MKKVLVTGSTGALASKFVTKYSAEYEFFLGKRNPRDQRETKFESWSEIDPAIEVDLIIHFAGKYLIDESLESKKTVQDSVIGTAHSVINYSMKKRTPIIALGSYFEKAPEELSPWSHYSIAKNASRELFQHAASSFGIPIRYLYCYDIYGFNLSRGKIVDVMLDPKTERLSLSLGEQIMNLTHEDDFAVAIDHTARDLFADPQGFKANQIRHFRDEYTLREISEVINAKRSTKIEFDFGGKPYREKEVFAIWDCAPNIPDWEPRIQFEEFVSEFTGTRN
jgi:nucleoside-diphosphate-sugar epimerase